MIFNMETKVLKIHYPSLEADEIGQITAAMRDKILSNLKNGRISYSFSSQKNSGYIMVYPTDPILSIRVSNHTSDGDKPPEELIETKRDSKTINAEAENGQMISEAALITMLQEAEEASRTIKQIIKDNYGE